MKLLCSPASPYSAKVRMAAAYLELDLTEVKVDSSGSPSELIENNPLAKIPTLITDDGRAIYDSRAIMHHLDRMVADKRLYPRADDRRTDAEVLEALCDGITDCLLAIVYEKRFRPAEKIHQPWIDRQWGKVTRGLDFLDANAPKAGRNLNGGHFALAALLGYLALRFPGQWEADREALATWTDGFEKQFEAYATLKPRA